MNDAKKRCGSPRMKSFFVAIEAALAGGAILRSYYGRELSVNYKGALDLVTQADTKSESVILEILRKRLPNVSILAEESGRADRDRKRRFIVDPLDGTTNFAHTYPMFAVSIAYEEDGRVCAGVVYDPLRDELFTAQKGKGAYLNGLRMKVSQTTQLERSLLVTGFPYDLREDLEGNLRLFTRFMGVARAVRRDGSAALDLCYLAAGRFDGFWEEKLGPWDTAAGALIVEESGGVVTDFSGNIFDYKKNNIVASNGRVNSQMIELF